MTLIIWETHIDMSIIEGVEMQNACTVGIKFEFTDFMYFTFYFSWNKCSIKFTPWRLPISAYFLFSISHMRLSWMHGSATVDFGFSFSPNVLQTNCSAKCFLRSHLRRVQLFFVFQAIALVVALLVHLARGETQKWRWKCLVCYLIEFFLVKIFVLDNISIDFS